MKHKALRTFIKSKDLHEPHSLKRCRVVIDGDCYFRNSYQESGCQSLFGPECDKYANHLRKILIKFTSSYIEGHVIFKGEANITLDKRTEIQQAIINTKTVNFDKENASNMDPMFLKKIQREVLEIMNIKYFVCEYDSLDAIVSLACKFKCPVLTDNIEYSLLGASCIPIKSLTFIDHINEIKCSIYNSKKIRAAMGIYKMAPILLMTVLNESGDYYKEVPTLVAFSHGSLEYHALRWVKRQKPNEIYKIAEHFSYGNERKTFMKTYEKLQLVYSYPNCHLAVKYFQRPKPYGLFKDDKKWFSKGIADGRLAIPFVNLKSNKILCGSKYINDIDKPDAMLAAIDIIAYSDCLLTNSENTTITFIGREFDEVRQWKINNEFSNINNKGMFNFSKKTSIISEDLFIEFLKQALPGYQLYHILSVPITCRIIVVTLVYYIHKVNKDFEKSAHYILLCYIILGYILTKIKENFIQSTSFQTNVGEFNDVNDRLKFLFKEIDAKHFDVSIVHSLTEFQHCLEYMNYLNKMCGEKTMPCTVYHEAYNANVVYNALLLIKDEEQLLKLLVTPYSTVLSTYKSIINGFEECLSAVRGKPKKGDLEKLMDKQKD